MTGPRCETWEVPAQAQFVPHVRKLAREALEVWGYKALVPDVALGVSELLTNAIIHGTPQITVTLEEANGHVKVTVVDENPDMPHLVNVQDQDTSENGRGLALVADLAREMGWRPIHHGKEVWFSCALPDDAS
jgi:anti-sigma regulatory factor (Ser/Thr protein kinase)